RRRFENIDFVKSDARYESGEITKSTLKEERTCVDQFSPAVQLELRDTGMIDCHPILRGIECEMDACRPMETPPIVHKYPRGKREPNTCECYSLIRILVADRGSVRKTRKINRRVVSIDCRLPHLGIRELNDVRLR